MALAVDSATPYTRAPRVRVRRDVRWLAAGILAVVLGGLGTWALFSTVTDTKSAVKLTRTVYRGQVLQPQDVAVVALSRSADVPAVSGDQLNALVGQRARTDLPAGSLLVGESLGAPDVAAGVVRVGAKVDAGRLPSTAMSPGTPVLVVAVPASNQAAGTLAASVKATLASPPSVGPDGAYLVDLNVAEGDGEVIARLSALKQISIVQRSES